jgi:hypothetical protein
MFKKGASVHQQPRGEPARFATVNKVDHAQTVTLNFV